MIRYILKRLLQMIPLLLIISFIAFGIIRIAEVYANADPLTQLKMNPSVTDETIERERQRLALDKPFLYRYVNWVSRSLQGDLGESYYYKTSVISLIMSRLWNTVTLGLATVIFTWLIAIPLGIYLAVRQYSLVDQIFSSVSYFFMGFPDFFLAILLLLFAAYTGLFPIGGMTNPENNHLKKIEEINQGIYTYPKGRTPSQATLKADEESRRLAKQQISLNDLKADLKKELTLKELEKLSSVTSQKVVAHLDKLSDQIPTDLVTKANDEFKANKSISAPVAREILKVAKSKQTFGWTQKWAYKFSHMGDLIYHYSRHIPDVFHHLVLPCLTLSLISIASLQRRMRANLLDILGEEYIKTARAKGLSENKVIYKHAVRNAINPIITLLGFEIAGLISGAAFVEIIFSWPGLGNMMLQAILGNDLNLAMAGLISGAFMLLIGNLLADLLLAAVDPRIKLEA